jgi:hypothetical protein
VTPPVPGVLNVTLATPNANDRAALLTITGPAALTQLEAVGAGVVLHQRASGTTVHVAVFGPLASGGLLRFTVPDVNKAASYTVTVTEVAADTNRLRDNLAGYVTTVAR